MHLILIISILLRLAGVVYSISLWRRLGDWRVLSLTAILALLSGRQIFTLGNELAHPHDSIWGHATEIPPLFISVFTLLALFLFGRMLVEKQTAVDALRISEHKFSKAFRYTPDAISIVRLDDGLVVDVNEGFESMTGFLREEAIGKSIQELGIWADERDRERFGEIIRRHGRIQDFESKIRTRSGAEISFQASSETFNLHGRTHVVSVARDVSQTRRRQRDLIEAIEGEQRRIGHDLHDSLAQDLVSLALQLQLVVNAAKDRNVAAVPSIQRINDNLKKVIENTRRMAQGLSPVDLEQGGLTTAVRRLADNISEIHGIHCTYSCSPNFPTLQGAAALNVYRIAQEAANNAIRHSRCKSLWINLERGEGELVLAVEDDGIGIHDRSAGPGMGLAIMDYRAKALGGSVIQTERAAGGTCVRCSFPVTDANTSHDERAERIRTA
jgi:PAS domain S-box-containing protein